MMSEHWIWELRETFAAKPVGVMIQRATGKGNTIYTSYPYFRPSLNFYAQRSIVPASSQELIKRWREDNHPHLLLDEDFLKKLPRKQVQVLGMTENWFLVSRAPALKTTITAKRRK